jgi:two-component system, chemotaxis family, CheB/CheR fusion protein
VRGEEAYSLAILLLEEAARRESAVPIQVFASDLHENSLAKAREGFYPETIEADVSPERLKRFFQKEDSGYRVRKEVRERVLFAPHNLLGDPPFSRIHLISCRNLLIYLQPDLQRDIVELFHYALKANGYLLVGTAETVNAGDLFHAQDKKSCIYRKRNVPAPESRLPVFALSRPRTPESNGPDRRADPIAYGALHERMAERYAPPSALVGPEDDVVHFSQHASRYLLNPGGLPTNNVFRLVRPELQLELRAAVAAARSKGQPVDSRPVPVRFNSELGLVTLHVRPAFEPEETGFVLVIFAERDSDEAH